MGPVPPFHVAPADDRRAHASRASLYDRVLFGRQTVLVAVALLCVVLHDRIGDPAAAATVLVVAGAVNVAHHQFHRRRRVPRALSLTQLCIDVAVVSYLVAVTGGSASPFVVLYLAGVLASSATLSHAAPWLAVACSGIGYVAALRAAGEGASSVSAAYAVMLLGVGALASGHVRRMQALLRFRAAAVAHEIKNSAHSARLLLDEARADLGDEAGHLLDAAATELQGLSSLAQRLYGLSAPSSVRSFQLGTVLDEALVLAGPSLRAARVRVEFEPSGYPVWLRADADALRHGVLNLLLNAAEHGPAGGVVRARIVTRWRETRIEVDSVSGEAPSGGSAGPDRLEPVTDAPRVGPGGWGIGGRVVRDLLVPFGGRLEMGRIEGGLRAAIVMPAWIPPWSGRARPTRAVAARGAP